MGNQEGSCFTFDCTFKRFKENGLAPLDSTLPHSARKTISNLSLLDDL